jgi:hypothetical protein
MNEKELAKALLRMGGSELANPPGPHELTEKVLSRDRRRVRIVAAITIFFWGLSALLLYGFLFPLVGLIAQFQHEGGAPADPRVVAVYKFLIVLGGSLEALILAFLCTMVLLFVSRRASLRQINANLVEISQELKRHSQQKEKGQP